MTFFSLASQTFPPPPPQSVCLWLLFNFQVRPSLSPSSLHLSFLCRLLDKEKEREQRIYFFFLLRPLSPSFFFPVQKSHEEALLIERSRRRERGGKGRERDLLRLLLSLASRTDGSVGKEEEVDRKEGRKEKEFERFFHLSSTLVSTT